MNNYHCKCLMAVLLGCISLAGTVCLSNSPSKINKISEREIKPACDSVRTFGVRGDGKTDDTTALQNAMDACGQIVLPKGIYKTTSTLYLRADNTVLTGQGPSATVIKYEGTGQAIAHRPLPVKTLYWCRLFGLRIEAVNKEQVGPLVNWTSMQFGELHDLWLTGNGDKTTGILLSAIPKKTEATYNVISHCYIGSVHTGIEFGAGANSNTVETSRFQPSNNGVGIVMRGVISNNHIIHSGFEYPGKVSGGILIDGDVHNTLIEGNRFEGLAFGWKINGNSNTNTVVLGNYYGSIKKASSWISQGLQTQNYDQMQGGA